MQFQAFVNTRREQLRKIFDEVDTSNDGQLDAQEIEITLTRLGYKATHERVKLLMQRLDKNHNDKIDFEEWCDFLLLLPRLSIVDAFNYWQVTVPIDIGDAAVIPESGAAWKVLVAGGFAGAVSRTMTAPLDRLKIILQVQGSHGVVASFMRMWKEEGIRGCWRGNGANVVKIVPEAGVRFLAFDRIKTLVVRDPNQPTIGERLLSGGLAGITSQIAIYPLEVVRTRLAVSNASQYGGMSDAFLSTLRNEGITALYRGISPALLGIFPYAAIDLGVYDMLKTAYCKAYDTKQPDVTTLLSCGAISSLSGQLGILSRCALCANSLSTSRISA